MPCLAGVQLWPEGCQDMVVAGADGAGRLEPDPDFARDLFELRAIAEPNAARLAAHQCRAYWAGMSDILVHRCPKK